MKPFLSTLTTEPATTNYRSKLAPGKLIPRYWKEVLVMLVLTPILTELLTNNIPARSLFKPKNFLLFAILVYGPVLLLRELAVRWKLNLTGHVILGLVYGFYNEGLVAKTIFQAHVPNPAFNNYGMVWGINLTWAFVIVVFHAFYAFVFPLLIVHSMFPSSANKPWLAKRLWLVLSGFSIAYISYSFLKHLQKPVVPMHFVTLAFVMAGLCMLSKHFRRREMARQGSVRLWPLCIYGIAFVITTFALSNIMAVNQVNYLLFLAYMLLSLYIVIVLLRNYDTRALLVFCFAAQLAFAGVCLWVAIVNRSRPGIYTSSIFILIFIVALLRMMIRRTSEHNRPGMDASQNVFID